MAGGTQRTALEFGSTWRRARLSATERVARGKQARQQAPRSSHGEWEAPGDRADPVALLEEQAESRVSELVPIRYGRMATSPFAFFRGGALVMAADLAATPTSGITVQLCGDAHLANFGVFGTPERRLVFDVNDFDETLPGPWEWDVKRLAASFEIAARDRGFGRSERRTVVTAAVRAYRTQMRHAARMKTLDAWYEHLDADRLLREVDRDVRGKRLAKRDAAEARRQIAKARMRDSVRVFAKRVETSEGGLRIAADPPLIVPVEDLVDPGSLWDENPETAIKSLLASYRLTLAHDRHPLEEFRYVHAARKVVGVGSVGTRCYILLLVGRDDRDPLFLQVKEAQPSVLERFLEPSEHENHGERVVVGQRLMQATSDIFLGWQRIKGLDGHSRDYYVRQFHDWKGSVDIESFEVASAASYARLCGGTLARAHARWGDRIAIASYLGPGDGFDRAIARFAAVYADQNERDHRMLVDAIGTGRVSALDDT